MNPLIVFLALLALSAPTWTLAQNKDYSKKDYKRAKSVVEKDADYQEIDSWTWLPQAERELLKVQVIETIAAKLNGKKPSKFKNIDIASEDGLTTKQITHRSYSGTPRYIKYNNKSYEVVELEQDIPEIPEKSGWVEDPIMLHNFGNLFEDNKWAPGGKNADSVAAVLQKVKAVIAQSNGERKITGIMIKSSASTLKNTIKDKEGKTTEMTHADLALKRAEAARDFVQAQLGDLVKDASVQINADGINYDKDDSATFHRKGTSGPSSPYACPSGTDPKYCPDGDDAYLDQVCAEAPKGKGGVPTDVDADGDDVGDPWDWNDDIVFDCADWTRVKEISRVSPNKWTKDDKALIRSFYASFKYVGVKITAIKKTLYTKKADGKAHMVLAIIENDPVVGTKKIKNKSHFKTTKYTRSEPSEITKATSRKVSKACKNNFKKRKINKRTGLAK